MGMPVIALDILDRDDVFNNLIGSIALQEAALAHLLNADGEKLQTAIKLVDPSISPNTTLTLNDLLDVNNSVGSLVANLSEFEIALKDKFNLILNYVLSGEQLPASVEFSFYNRDGTALTKPIVGSVYSATGRVALLDGTYVNIYQTATSDVNGEVTFKLPPSYYDLRQISVPPGYTLDPDSHSMLVAEEETTIDSKPTTGGSKVTLTNK